MHRITFNVDRLGFLNKDFTLDEQKEYWSYHTPFVGRVKNSEGLVLFETEPVECVRVYNEGTRQPTKEYRESEHTMTEGLRQQCLTFLKDNYPDYKDINAYWD